MSPWRGREVGARPSVWVVFSRRLFSHHQHLGDGVEGRKSAGRGVSPAKRSDPAVRVPPTAATVASSVPRALEPWATPVVRAGASPDHVFARAVPRLSVELSLTLSHVTCRTGRRSRPRPSLHRPTSRFLTPVPVSAALSLAFTVAVLAMTRKPSLYALDCGVARPCVIDRMLVVVVNRPTRWHCACSL